MSHAKTKARLDREIASAIKRPRRRFLVVTFDVTGFSKAQISALSFEAEVQGEESDDHPEATVTSETKESS